MKVEHFDSITYTAKPDNSEAVKAFIGPIPPCPICNGYGEYWDENGITKSCPPCNSRCIPFIDFQGNRRTLDWGDTLIREADGLHLLKGT